MVRPVELNNDSLLHITIINGLLPEIRRDVTLQQPKSLDELTAAAAISKANVRANAVRVWYDDAAIACQVTELRTMMMQFQEMMMAQQRQVVGMQSVEPTTYHPEPPAKMTTKAAMHRSPSAATMTAALPATTINTPVTVNLVMPETTATQYGSVRSCPGGKSSIGRGWRRPWRGRPAMQQPGVQQPNVMALPFQPIASTPASRNWSLDNDTHIPPYHLCAIRHTGGDCNVADAVSYQCSRRGHHARCCRNCFLCGQ